MKGIKKIRIGTRGSRLAVAQANLAVKLIISKISNIECEIIVIKTGGDLRPNVPVEEFGGKGAFVYEIEKALLDLRIDLAVHSAKDIPVKLADGLEICGTLERADPRDVLVTRTGHRAEQRIIVGTGSLRRSRQLKDLMPFVECIPLRGNVDTRIRRLKAGEFDGLVLAAAGLERLGYTDDEELRFKYFSADEMIPAAGQGIIAIEGRCGDRVSEMFRDISDKAAETALYEERRAMRGMGAGCHDAVGAYFDGEKLLLYGV